MVEGLDCDRGAREQSAAAYGRDHDVEFGQFLDQLERRGALARDHPHIVEGVHERRAGFALNVRAGRIARRNRRCAEAYAGAAAADVVLLDLCGVLGHHDVCRNAAPLRRVRQRRAVVARRMRHDAAPRLGIGERKNCAGRAARLEGAGALQVLGLEEQPRPDFRVERTAGEHRGAMHVRRDACLRRANRVQIRQRGCRGFGFRHRRT